MNSWKSLESQHSGEINIPYVVIRIRTATLSSVLRRFDMGSKILRNGNQQLWSSCVKLQRTDRCQVSVFGCQGSTCLSTSPEDADLTPDTCLSTSRVGANHVSFPPRSDWPFSCLHPGGLPLGEKQRSLSQLM